MTQKTRQMPRKSQVAFAKAWLEKQGIAAETVDVDGLIDGSLSYEENIKNIKSELKIGTGRSKKKATKDLTAAECDVSIGNYQAGYNSTETKRACDCGDPDACEDLAPKKKKLVKKKTPVTKPTPAPKKPYVEEHPELKKKPMKKKKKPPKTINGKQLKKKLTKQQLTDLVIDGFVDVKINGKKHRITKKHINIKGELI